MKYGTWLTMNLVGQKQRSQFASDSFKVSGFDTSIQKDLSIRLCNRIQVENADSRNRIPRIALVLVSEFSN